MLVLEARIELFVLLPIVLAAVSCRSTWARSDASGVIQAVSRAVLGSGRVVAEVGHSGGLPPQAFQ